MLRSRSVWISAVALSVALAAGAQASSITGFVPNADAGFGTFAPAAPSAAAFPGPANSFKSPVAVNGDNPGTPGPSPNFVNLSATVTALHGPIDGTFTVLDFNGIGGIDGAHEYFFTITITNANPWHPISGQLVVELLSGPGIPLPASGVNFDNPSDMLPFPSSSYTGLDAPLATVWTPQRLIFGGLLGGGGEIPQGGGVGTISFSVDIPDGVAGNFILRLTPNPEPTSLALGALGMSAFGLVGFGRRWRKKKSV